MNKIPVYFMPGLAASPKIFENIKLPEDRFEMYYLEWIMPKPHEPLTEYAKRVAANITHENPVLIGVSFGGILVQEISGIINARKVIIVSSVRSSLQFPRRMRFAKMTRAYRMFPTSLMQKIDWLAKVSFGNNMITRKLNLYEKYMSFRDKKYLDWAFETVITWNRAEVDEKVVHIHGTADEVFPARYIHNYIPVKGGTHIMIVNKYKWLNENLPHLIEGEKE